MMSRTPETDPPSNRASGSAPATNSAAADPTRFATAWAALVYALGTLALGFPALAGKFLVNPRSDQYIAGYSFREFAAQTLSSTGSFPQWNPYLFGGMPYVAAMHGDIFYPTFLLRMVMPTDAAMTWGFMIHVFFAGLFAYLFFRAVGLGFWASLVGGLAYMMSGNIAGLVSPGHDGKLFVSALLPLALLLVTRGVRDGRRWAWGALAIVIGLAVLSPHPQLLQYLLLLTGAFALFLAFVSGREVALPRAEALKRLAFAGIAIVVGGAMGAIQYLPVRQYVPWSPRAGGKGWDHAVSYSMPPEELLNTYLPQFTGMLDAYWGRNGIHFHSDYIGAAVLVLAGLAFGAALSRSDKRLIWFWLGALIISTLWALGGFTPFYTIVYAIVPGTKFFRAPSTMLFIVAFCVAVLAAFGAERVLRGDVPRRYLLGWLAVAGLVALLGVAGGLTNLAVTIGGGNPRGVDAVLANSGAVAAGAIRSFIFVALTCGVIFGIATHRLSARLGGALLVIAIGTDLWSIGRSYWQFSEPAAVTFASDATIDYVEQDSLPGRVLTINENGRDPYLNGDALMAHRVPVVLGYHGNELGNFDRLAGREEGFRQVSNPNFWKLLNVRYILTAREDLGIPELERVVGPVTNAYGTPVYLFKIPDPNPFAWVAPLIVKAADDVVLNTVLDPRFDVRRAALFDTSAAVEGKSPDALPEPLSIRTKVTRPSPEEIIIELDAPAPAGSALIISENYYPGWTATVDGTAQPVERTAVSLMGVSLAAGSRKIELEYRNQPYETGKTVTLFALALAVAMLAAGVVMDRRRRV